MLIFVKKELDERKDAQNIWSYDLVHEEPSSYLLTPCLGQLFFKAYNNTIK